ncbi:MAG: DUF1178 family protein [Rhodoferax sp.]
MKVLDLQCPQGHCFEGWFASEEDFAAQCGRALVQCPVCSDPSVVKKLSAPRLNLAGSRPADPVPPSATGAGAGEQVVLAAWLAAARHVIANTADVGAQFAEEARKMHYREVQPRGIRGTATPEETRSLQDEGIEVLPFALPAFLKEPLQ